MRSPLCHAVVEFGIDVGNGNIVFVQNDPECGKDLADSSRIGGGQTGLPVAHDGYALGGNGRCFGGRGGGLGGGFGGFDGLGNAQGGLTVGRRGLRTAVSAGKACNCRRGDGKDQNAAKGKETNFQKISLESVLEL